MILAKAVSKLPSWRNRWKKSQGKSPNGYCLAGVRDVLSQLSIELPKYCMDYTKNNYANTCGYTLDSSPSKWGWVKVKNATGFRYVLMFFDKCVGPAGHVAIVDTKKLITYADKDRPLKHYSDVKAKVIGMYVPLQDWLSQGGTNEV